MKKENLILQSGHGLHGHRPQDSDGEVLIPSTSEWDCFGRGRLCRSDSDKMRPLGWTLAQCDWCP